MGRRWSVSGWKRGSRGALALFGVTLTSLLCAANYATRIDTREVFDAVTISEDFRPDILRAGKYLAPAVDDEVIPVCYQNVNIYPRHLEFMATEFPERFPAMTPAEYLAIVEQRATRRYWAGALFEIAGGQFGITIFTYASSTDELPTREEVAAIIGKLTPTFTLGPICYVPDSEAARENARAWQDPPFCIYYLEGDDEVTYEPYSLATGYGRVRIMTAQEAQDASDAGALSWQDILILDGVPPFLESIIAGVITGARQGELSHLNVRASRRGTPNAFVKNPRTTFAQWEGKLVKLVVGPLAYEGPVEVTEAEAQTWWEEHRPHVEPPAPADLAWSDFTPLNDTTESVTVLKQRFGAKAGNLGLLYQCLPEQYQVRAFGIPFRYYKEFMERNVILDRRTSPPRAMTCQAYLTSLLNDSRFTSDSAYRSRTLAGFVRELDDYTVVDPELVAAIAAQAEKVYGSTRVMLRFRSSSNMEDGIVFSGAGLYDSFSGCPEDSVDEDADGPSACDPTRGERTIESAIKRVWASLWNMRAFEERTYYQLPQDQAVMGILVTPAFPDEAANGVAFTGNPFDAFDRRYLINVQLGDASVVIPDPTVWPEKDILTVDDGVVSTIVRARTSSLVPPGTYVLSNGQLEELGRVCAIAAGCFPVDPGDQDPSRIIADIEFKFTRQGRLFVKQIRPFLIPEPLVNIEYPFKITIPPGTQTAGSFLHTRTLDVEQAHHAWAKLREGVHEFTMRGPNATGDLIERLWLGASDREAVAESAGQYFLVLVQQLGQPPQLELTYRQRFTAPDGAHDLTLKLLTFDVSHPPPELVFDEHYLSYAADTLGGLAMSVVPSDVQSQDEAFQRTYRFGSTTYADIPLYHVEIKTQNERIELWYRLKRLFLANGPAQLMKASVGITEGTAEIERYWQLVYAADWHNTLQTFRVILDPPLGMIYAIDINEPYGNLRPAKVALRGRDMEIVRTLVDVSYRETLIIDQSQVPFIRGDANADGQLNLTDAVVVLKYATGRVSSVPCRKALDVNDDKRINIADAVRLLGYLFAGDVTPAAPFEACALDQTVLGDPLTCAAYAPCVGR